MKKINNVNPLDILKRIMRDDTIKRDTFVIIITGRVGPTGKTWLCKELRDKGYRAMEMSPLFHSLNLKDDGVNHVIIDDCTDQVIVVLNEILPMYNKNPNPGQFTQEDWLEVKQYDIRAEAEEILRQMKQIAEWYGCATRADWMTLNNVDPKPVDRRWGWVESAVKRARIIPGPFGWFIEFPRAVPLLD